MGDWREEWRETNRANWDERVPIHVSGEFYDVEGSRRARSACGRSSWRRSATCPARIWSISSAISG